MKLLLLFLGILAVGLFAAKVDQWLRIPVALFLGLASGALAIAQLSCNCIWSTNGFFLPFEFFWLPVLAVLLVFYIVGRFTL